MLKCCYSATLLIISSIRLNTSRSGRNKQFLWVSLDVCNWFWPVSWGLRMWQWSWLVTYWCRYCGLRCRWRGRPRSCWNWTSLKTEETSVVSLRISLLSSVWPCGSILWREFPPQGLKGFGFQRRHLNHFSPRQRASFWRGTVGKQDGERGDVLRGTSLPEFSASRILPQQRYVLHCLLTFSFAAQWNTKIKKPNEDNSNPNSVTNA